MGNYKATSKNSTDFIVTLDGQKIGELSYQRWYTFDAEMNMADGKNYRLEPKSFWDSKIELKDNKQVFAEAKLGWKGFVIMTFFDGIEQAYSLKPKGILSSTFLLTDAEKRTMLTAETLFKWNKINFDYNIETSSIFDGVSRKEILVLTVLHCLNYYMSIATSTT